MSANEPQKHVNRIADLEAFKRLNELEAIVPIYRQALDHIADASGSGPWGLIADRALREAQLAAAHERHTPQAET